MGSTREEIEKKLLKAGSIDEVKSIIEGSGDSISDDDAKMLYDKIKSMDSEASVELSVEELDSVSGGRRDFMKEGCKATVEAGSNCWGNDFCGLINVWYDAAPEQNCPKCGAGMGKVREVSSLKHIIKCHKCGFEKEVDSVMTYD